MQVHGSHIALTYPWMKVASTIHVPTKASFKLDGFSIDKDTMHDDLGSNKGGKN